MCTLLRAAESGHISHFKSLIRIQVFIQVHISPWSLARPAGNARGPAARAPGCGHDVRATGARSAFAVGARLAAHLNACGCLPKPRLRPLR